MDQEKKVEKKTTKKINKKIEITKYIDLEGKFLLVKVGNQDQPASLDDIDNVRTNLVSLFEKNNISCIAFVTHHAVSMEIIEKKIKQNNEND